MHTPVLVWLLLFLLLFLVLVFNEITLGLFYLSLGLCTPLWLAMVGLLGLFFCVFWLLKYIFRLSLFDRLMKNLEA